MKEELRETAREVFDTELESLPERGRRVLERYGQRRPISHDTNDEFETQMTVGERLADRVATFGGSWTFISLFGIILFGWILINSLLLTQRGGAFDPYPYILLNLVLSTLASIQAPIILMAQNRQSSKDRIAAAHDYEVNLKAELEILALHKKIDELRESKWAELIAIQQKQIELLTELLKGRK